MLFQELAVMLCCLLTFNGTFLYPVFGIYELRCVAHVRAFYMFHLLFFTVGCARVEKISYEFYLFDSFFPCHSFSPVLKWTEARMELHKCKLNFCANKIYFDWIKMCVFSVFKGKFPLFLLRFISNFGGDTFCVYVCVCVFEFFSWTGK